MIRDRFDSLAIVTGRPAFAEPLHVGRPNIGDESRLLARIQGMLARRWLTNDGPLVREFESRIAQYVGVKHCVAMCNATVGLEIAIRAMGLKGEVIVPSLTFVATAHALQWQEITPVFADIAPGTHHLSVQQAERMITPRTTGIIGVHLWGQPCDVEGLTELARQRNLRLMFDAAHAFGCSHRGMMIGSFGEAEVFSFHATKFMNSFEGGAVVTNNDDLAERMRLMRNFGFAGFDNVVHVGTNGKMNEVCAAMGLTSLESVESFIAANRANYHSYRRELDGLPGIRMQTYDERERANFQYIVLEVDPTKAGVSRDHLQAVLAAENVKARRYFWPGCHRMEPYRSNHPNAGLMLVESEAVAERLLSLPTGTAISDGEIRVIGSILRTALADPAAVRSHLGALPATIVGTVRSQIRREPVFAYGAGGHARVVASLARSHGLAIDAFVEDTDVWKGDRSVDGVPVLSWEKVQATPGGLEGARFLLAIGDNQARERSARAIVDAGGQLLSLVHPQAIVDPTAAIAPGAVVMASAIVNADATIGSGAIINTAAIIEHGSRVGAFAHVSPNATLGGNARIGDRAHVGLSATVLPSIEVGRDARVGAGSVVVQNVADGVTVMGVPARPKGTSDNAGAAS